jgi:hypothetical protein
MGRSSGKVSKSKTVSRSDKFSKTVSGFTSTEKEAYEFALLVDNKKDLLFGLDQKTDEYKKLEKELVDLAGGVRGQQIIIDILSRFKKTGAISSKQIDLLLKLKNRASQQKAERLRLPDPAPVPFSKEPVDVEGEVVSIKLRDRDPYYGEFVITVVDDRGFKVWGPMTNKHAYKINPDGTKTALMRKGDRVLFKAKLKPSDRDETFGFFKDPDF